MINISVTKKSSNKSSETFNVKVSENRTETNHTVTLDNDYFKKLANSKVSREELIEKSFRFLLERESKESILESFNLDKIAYYFPEYEKVIANIANLDK